MAIAARASTDSMRAVVLYAFGNADTSLKYVEDHLKPTRRSGEVLIAVKASSINPADWKTRTGVVPTFLVKLPKILGGDVAGIVVEADANSKFKPGARVFGNTGHEEAFRDPFGAYAEFVSAREVTLCTMPDKVSFNEAAAVPMAAMTAWQACKPAMPLQGKRVLVHAGSGGVGGFAIQIAKAQGAHVTTTCSGRNIDFVTKALGADVAVDYTKDRFEAASPEPYDLVVDLVGGSYESRSLPLLKRCGHMRQSNSGYIDEYGGLLGAFLMMFKAAIGVLRGKLGLGPFYSLVMQDSTDNECLQSLADLMAEGKLKVHIDRVVPLEGVAEAHAYAEQRRTRGKVVIQVAE